MKQVRITQLTLQQPSQIQELIIVPILTLLFLGLVVRTASSAVDLTVEKRKITEQLKRRLSEQLAALQVERQTVSLVRPVSEALLTTSGKTAISDGQPPHFLTASRLAQAVAR